MSAATCALCHWAGPEADLVPNYVSARACPRCKMSTGVLVTASAEPAPQKSILDAAIAGSTALDPSGNRKAADHLRLPTHAEKQAQQERLADYFRKNGVL